jgi:hypothetical protein
VSAPIAEDRPQVPRWVYLAESGVPLDASPMTMAGTPVVEIRVPAAASPPRRPRRMDLLLLLALLAATILGLSILLGTGPERG